MFRLIFLHCQEIQKAFHQYRKNELEWAAQTSASVPGYQSYKAQQIRQRLPADERLPDTLAEETCFGPFSSIAP